MSFKHDADTSHVQNFRTFVAKIKLLDQDIDTNKLTPDEAWAEVEKLVSETKFPAAPEHVKKAQAEAKKVEEEEKQDAKKASEPVEHATSRGGR